MISFVSVKDHAKVGSFGLLAIIEHVRIVEWPTAILVCVAVTLTSGGTVKNTYMHVNSNIYKIRSWRLAINVLHATLIVIVAVSVPARFLTVTTYDPFSVCEMFVRVSVDVAVGGSKPLFMIVTRSEPLMREEVL